MNKWILRAEAKRTGQQVRKAGRRRNTVERILKVSRTMLSSVE